jgi:hypothetical protein
VLREGRLLYEFIGDSKSRLEDVGIFRKY